MDIMGHSDLENLYNDIAAIMGFFRKTGEATLTEVRSNVEFDQNVGPKRDDLMDTNLLELLSQIGYLSKRENTFVYSLSE
jgi:hypothetical protein